MNTVSKLVMCFGNFNGHAGWHIDGFDGVHGGFVVGQVNLEERMLLKFCLEKELCQIHGLTEEKRKLTFRLGENETEIDFVLLRKEHLPTHRRLFFLSNFFHFA